MRGLVPFALALVASVSFVEPACARTLQVEDTRRIVSLEEPAISKDGRRIAFIAVRSNYVRSRYDNELFVLDVGSRHLRSIARGNDVAVPRWSPDGRTLGYLRRDDGGRMSLYVHSQSGRDRLVAAAAGDVNDFAWRPDNAAIAFSAYDATDKRPYFMVGDNDYTTTSTTPPVHLWSVDANGARKHRLTSGGWTVAPTDPGGIFTSQFAWSPNGRRLLYTRVENTASGDDEFSSIWSLDIASGVSSKLTQHKALELTPQFSPDGNAISYWYPVDGDYLSQNELHVLDQRGDIALSHRLDRNVGGAAWLPDGRGFLACGNDGAHGAAWILENDGHARRLDVGSLNVTCDSYSSSTFDAGIAASIAADGSIAFLATDSAHARELYLLRPGSRTPARLTHFNDFVEGLQLGHMTQFQWTGPDVQPETGVLTYPPGAHPGGRYPIVLLIHGGPGLSSIDTFVPETWPLAQLIASRGYIVFQPNYRGSDDHGNFYMRSIFQDTVAGPASDITTGLDAVKRLPEADSSRVAVSGWSYGGLLTSWLITQSHEWKAAVSGAAVNDEIEEYALSTSNVQNRYYLGTSPYAPGGQPIYLAQSPLTYAAAVTTPTLIWSTTGDPVVPTTMSYSFFHVLREHGVPVQFAQFTAPTHGPNTPVATEALTHLWLSWLDRYLH